MIPRLPVASMKWYSPAGLGLQSRTGGYSRRPWAVSARVPPQCIFVGDGGAEELRAARELGFTTVMVTGYIDLPEEKFAARRAFADYTVRFVDELTGLS